MVLRPSAGQPPVPRPKRGDAQADRRLSATSAPDIAAYEGVGSPDIQQYCAPVTADSAKRTLHGYLCEDREAMVWKLDRLSEYDVRRPLTPTCTNLLGLVKHLWIVEALYFGKPSTGVRRGAALVGRGSRGTDGHVGHAGKRPVLRSSTVTDASCCMPTRPSTTGRQMHLAASLGGHGRMSPCTRCLCTCWPSEPTRRPRSHPP